MLNDGRHLGGGKGGGELEGRLHHLGDTKRREKRKSEDTKLNSSSILLVLSLKKKKKTVGKKRRVLLRNLICQVWEGGEKKRLVGAGNKQKKKEKGKRRRPSFILRFWPRAGKEREPTRRGKRKEKKGGVFSVFLKLYRLVRGGMGGGSKAFGPDEKRGARNIAYISSGQKKGGGKNVNAKQKKKKGRGIRLPISSPDKGGETGPGKRKIPLSFIPQE